MFVYHVVTERPMFVGQQIIFDETHHSGVRRRVYEKYDLVSNIYAHPEKYDDDTLEHHTAVALRELAMEQVRAERYPQYPSRLSCLYVSAELEEAENWAKYFAELGRPTYHIVKLKAEGRFFVGDAAKCFRGCKDKNENLRLAEEYWSRPPGEGEQNVIRELLVDGKLTVTEIVKEINANL